MDDRFVEKFELNITTNNKGGGVTLEINCFQAGTAREHPSPNAGDAIGNRNARQTGAATERGNSDGDEADRDREVVQPGAARERREPDAGDAVGDRVASGFAARILD